MESFSTRKKGKKGRGLMLVISANFAKDGGGDECYRLLPKNLLKCAGGGVSDFCKRAAK